MDHCSRSRRRASSFLTRAALLAGIFILGSLTIVSQGHASSLTQAAATPEVLSPSINAVLNGPVTFSCSVQNLTGVATVEYLLDGKRFSAPVSSPFVLNWHTTYAWNGVYTVVAVARDANANEIARSPQVSFSIANETGGITLVAPANPNNTVAGNLPIAGSFSLAPGKQLERTLIAIDGNFLSPFFSLTPSTLLDTTTLRNGVHEVVLSAFDGIAIQSGAGFLAFPITVNNGHTLQEIRAAWKVIYAAPGAQTTLPVRAVYTDGVEQSIPSGIFYSSSIPSVATVDNNGNLTALSQGIAQITMSALGKTTTATVYVDPPHGFAHFSKGGGILTSYDPSRSMFLRTMFFLDSAQAMAQSPALGGALQTAGINAITQGLYMSPLSLGSPPDFPSWKSHWDSWWSGMANTAHANNVALFFTGDDFARSAALLDNSINGPYSTQAIQYALSTARDSGLAVAIDMVDETSALWGNTPTPIDGRWLTMSPPIPNNAFSRLMTIMNAVPNRTPISWPISGLTGGITAQNWFAPAFSDYSSHYWGLLADRYVYPWDASVNQYKTNMDSVLNDRLPLIDRTKPMLLLTTIAGNGYTKKGPGANFTPGQDSIDVDGPTPLNVSTQIMYAVARGMAGVRVYGYDSVSWKNSRAVDPIGSQGEQTGADPFGQGQDRWQVMSAAFNLIKRLEPDLLQPQTNAVDLGPDILTGAKLGSNSHVLIAVNFSESVHTETVNLQPYLYANATGVERYQLIEGDSFADTLTPAASVQQTFQAGETVIWVFRPGTAVTAPTNPIIVPVIPPVVPPVVPPAQPPVVTGSSSNPVAYWKLNEGSGNSALDSSGNGNTATLFNNPAWVSGAACKTGACVSFNGVNNSASASLDLSQTNVVSIAFWLNMAQSANNDALAFEFASGPFGFNGSTTGFMVDPNSSQLGGGQFEVGLKGNNGYNQIVFPRPSIGSWHNYVFVLDKSGASPNEVTPYVDGVAVPYTKTTNALNTNNFGKDTLFFMSRTGSSLFGSGSLDEISIYNRALSLAEISSLFQLSTSTGGSAAPTVSILQPAAGQVSGLVTATAKAVASTGLTISSVQLKVDGNNYGTPASNQFTQSLTLSTALDTTKLTNGTHTLTAVAVDSSNASTTSAPVAIVVNNVAKAASLAVVSGNGQAATAWHLAPTPLVVLLSDVNGQPISGATVTFQAPAWGAGGLFTGGIALLTVTTDTNGLASAGTITANSVTGNYAVTAEAAGLKAVINLSNIN